MAGELVFDLPTGWLDPETGRIHTRVEIREMTGYEEDLIGDQRLPYHVRMNRILAGCTVKIGDVTDKGKLERIMDELTSVDRMKILLMIRVASLGPMFDFNAQCPHCRVTGKYQVDLLTLQFAGLKDPKIRQYQVDLPSGKKATCRVLTGATEAKAITIPAGEVISGMILLRLVDLDGKGEPSLDDVKKMGLRDRMFLRQRFDDLEGGFERNIQVECRGCKQEFETQLDLGLFEMFYQDLRKKE
jgi:hypothetical protein